MQARIRATGDIYNVIDMKDYRNRIQLEDHNWYTMGEIELIEGNKPDWQYYHIQAAIAAMQGMLSSKETMESIAKQARKHNISIPTALAELSVDNADALIEELQKKGGQDD